MKNSSIRLLCCSLIVAIFLASAGLSESWAQTTIPEKMAPDACRSYRGDRRCQRWYQFGKRQVIVLKGVNFESGSARLTPESTDILDRDVVTLKKKGGNILIVGHTDSQGDSDSNQKLSEDRARAVMNYFSAKGISPSRMKADGMGENRPVASNDTEEGRALNRRIEVHIN